ncbi:MAG: hypothetical protein D3908_12600, partial [Candidatus Electrothrix sp. AUS4]|nr:hypothetical protein [Candidatus Electrothrix sp. AUS4]
MLVVERPKSRGKLYCLACLFLLLTFFAMPAAAQLNKVAMQQGDLFYQQFDNVSALASYKKA